MAEAENYRTVEIQIDYAPRVQMLAFHDRVQRWGVIVAHRRFGKTVACINELIKGALTCPLPDARFAYVAPTYGQAKDVAWMYLKRYAFCVPNTVAIESELRVDFPNGARVRLYGSDNYDRMRGIYFDGIICDEFGDQDPRSWTEVIRPALSDRKGWATFIGTPRGDNHFKDIWEAAQSNPEWFSLMLKASQTNVLDEEELRSARTMMTAEQYAAEYECSFAGSVHGSYYGEDLEKLLADGSIGDHGWLPQHAVHTAWDVGGTTAIWFFQVIGTQVRIIDYLEGVNKSADWYVQEIRSKPYTYGSHIAPSDADDEKEIVGVSWKSSLESLGLHNFIILPKQRSIDDGINQARLLLPRCKINVTNSGVKAGYTGLLNYRRDWDDKRKTFRDNPRHDWASHPADSFRYLAIGLPMIADVAGVYSDWSKPIKYRTKFII